METILVFYHLLALVKLWVSSSCSAVSLQHVLLPLHGSSLAVWNINIHGLLYFFSSPPYFLFSLGREQHKNCSIVPRTLTLFKLDQKASFLVNKQIRNLFSAQHILSAFQVPLHTRFWLLHCLFFCSQAKLFQPILNAFQYINVLL